MRLALVTGLALNGMRIMALQMVRSLLVLVSYFGFVITGVASTHILPDTLLDGFETSDLNLEKWQVQQTQQTSYWLDQTQFRTGNGSLAIKADPDDRACGLNCQRSEIRVSKYLQIPFGTEALYSFSFLLSGDTLNRENTRWVSGQWKQQADGSPFLAQRFAHGIFHITVQDNDCRILVAKSRAGHVKVPSTADSRFSSRHEFLEEKYRNRCETDIKVEVSDNAVLPEPFGQWIDMAYRIRGGRNGTGLIEIWANGNFIARVTGSIGNESVDGPMQYFKFGIYRDVMPGTGIAYLDNFKRTIVNQN